VQMKESEARQHRRHEDNGHDNWSSVFLFSEVAWLRFCWADRLTSLPIPYRGCRLAAASRCQKSARPTRVSATGLFRIRS